MSTATEKFLKILSDNEYKPLYNNIPEDNPNRDEIIAEIQDVLDDDGHLPDELRYFELNGEASQSALNEFLIKNLQNFKVEFLAGKHGDNDNLKTELYQQLILIKNDIKQKTNEANQLRDVTLIEMLNAKSRICAEVLEFITSHSGGSAQITTKKENPEPLSYNWLKGEEELLKFYNVLLKNGFIAENTQEDEFKAVFSNIPVSEINRKVQWERGAKLFAYFFDLLIQNNYIPQRPSWVNLGYVFTYIKSNKGIPEPIPENVKSNVTKINAGSNPIGSDVVDKLFEDD